MSTQHTPGWERGYGDAMAGNFHVPPPRGDTNRVEYEMGYQAGRHDRFAPVPPRLQHAARDLLAALVAHDEYMAAQFNEGPDSSAIHPKARENWLRVRAAITKAQSGLSPQNTTSA